MPGVAYDNTLPLSFDFSVGRDEFFAGKDQNGDSVPALGGTDGVDADYETNGTFLSISSDTSNPFYKIFSSASRIQINTTNNAIRFGNAGWVAGNSNYNATNATTPPSGDLDLSQAYSITLEISALPNAGGQLQIRVDNNTSSSSNSIHGGDSLLLSLDDAGGLDLGTLVVNVPGDITMNGVDIGDVSVHQGTENSFIAFRCPSNCGDTTAPDAGGIEISEVTIAYTGVPFTPAPPSPTTFSITPGDTTLDVSWAAVGGATGYDVGYGAVDDPADAGTLTIDDVAGTSTQITGLTNGTEYFVFIRSQNATGESAFSNNQPGSANPSGVPAGAPPAAPAAATLTADVESISATWAAVAGATTYDVAYNTTDSTTGATEILDLAGNGVVIPDLTAGTQYFVFVRAKNTSGTSSYGPSSSATPTAPVAGSWTGAALEIFGTDGTAASGSVDLNNTTQVTITSTGGAVSSDTRRHYFAYQQIAASDFTVTARVKSITANGGAVAAGNTERFGMLITNSIATGVATYADSGSWGSIGFYYDGTPALVGTRGQMKNDGTQSRSNISSLAVGDWIRIQIEDDGADKRIKRFTSTDGFTFTQQNSTTDFLADAVDDNWYWGFYGAPGANDVTVEYDNITITTP